MTLLQPHARIARVLELLETMGLASMDGKEDAGVILEKKPEMSNFRLTSRSYVAGYATPSIHFDMTA